MDSVNHADGWMRHGTRSVEQVETKVDPILVLGSPNNKVKYHECNPELGRSRHGQTERGVGQLDPSR
jgi:hypothetical protein